MMDDKEKSLPQIEVEEQLKKSSHTAAADGNEVATPLRKSASVRSRCLCSPTTHVGSFRCRLHRNGAEIRRGHSVGSDLSDLADKYATVKSPHNKATTISH